MTIQEAITLLYNASTQARLLKVEHVACEQAKTMLDKVLLESGHAADKPEPAPEG